MYTHSALSRHLPATSNRFDNMDPSSDVSTTTNKSFRTACTAKIISTKFPNVAFSRPPHTVPNLSAKISVIFPNSNARGINPTIF